jgi:hypothetical protein
MENFTTGSFEQRTKQNQVNKVTTTTANGAIPITTSGHYRLNSANATMTVAAPTVEGVELKIDNVAGTAAAVTVTSPDADATANVFSLPGASATSRASLVLKAILLDTTGALVWSSFMGAGVTVA